MEIIEATTEGLSPFTVDPAACFDTGSGALIFNVYETLVFFDGERLDRYLPQLATNWSIVENVPPIDDPDTGLTFKWTYYFKIRTGVPWHDSAFGNLTPADVEYTFERGMVMEAGYDPQWMFYEPLLNGASANLIDGLEYNPDSVTADAVFVGKAIDHAIESNSTHVWFNLVFDGAYAPFLQILTQSWSSILCKAWCNSFGRANWDGNWGDYTGWVTYHLPSTPPLDDPVPAMMGTGPFTFGHIDTALQYWDVNRFVNYWRGWGDGNPVNDYGIDWPAFGGSKPAGYIDHLKVSWAWDWPTRATMFLNGDVDFCAVPRQYIGQVLNQPNIRCIYPLPALAVDAWFYNFDVNPTTPYGPVFDYGVFNESGIPRDFFADVNIRKAFSHCINFTTFIDSVYLGEAIQPPTAIIPGLPQYDGTIQKYDYDLAEAATLFQTSPCWTQGFTIQIVVNIGAFTGVIPELLAMAINGLNSKFHASVDYLPWAEYYSMSNNRQLPCFRAGWSAEYPDAHDFAYAFYHSQGNFAGRQNYTNPVMDSLIEAGIQTPDGPERNAIYRQIQQLAIDDCPSLTTNQVFGRHFERTWINGWYYNPNYSGVYAGNLWKWYYTPHAQLGAVTNATANMLPYDVNCDGKVNMYDIGAAAASFGAIYGPPISSRWMYRCDFNNDRKVDMKDIGGVAQNFGKTSSVWTPSS